MSTAASPSSAITSTANAHGARRARSICGWPLRAPAIVDNRSGHRGAGGAIGVCVVVSGPCELERVSALVRWVASSFAPERGAVADAHASKSDTANAASATAASTAAERNCGLFEPADDSMVMRAIEQRDDDLRNRQDPVWTRHELGSPDPPGDDAHAQICDGERGDLNGDA